MSIEQVKYKLKKNKDMISLALALQSPPLLTLLLFLLNYYSGGACNLTRFYFIHLNPRKLSIGGIALCTLQCVDLFHNLKWTKFNVGSFFKTIQRF